MMYQQISASTIQAALLQGGMDARVEYHKRIDSTSTRARALVARNEWSPRQPVCILAGYQTAGRGRRAGKWYSPPNDSLLFTLIESSDEWEKAGALTTLSCALAVAEAMDKVYGLKAGIKWPNDVRVKKRKICGILVEKAQGPGGAATIIGIGVNANQTFSDFPEDLQSRATSLAMECGHPVDRLELLAQIVSSLAAVKRDFLAIGGARVLTGLRRRFDLMGDFLRIEREGAPAIEGTAMGIEMDGALVIRQAGGISVRCLSGVVVEFSHGGEE